MPWLVPRGLTTQQLHRLAASPLVTIGAHGVRHSRLSRASQAEVEQEMSDSRRLLQDLTDREIKHFAYPFGAFGKREAQIARSVGFLTAVTTERGTLFPEHLNHLYALPREPITGRDVVDFARQDRWHLPRIAFQVWRSRCTYLRR